MAPRETRIECQVFFTQKSFADLWASFFIFQDLVKILSLHRWWRCVLEIRNIYARFHGCSFSSWSAVPVPVGRNWFSGKKTQKQIMREGIHFQVPLVAEYLEWMRDVFENDINEWLKWQWYFIEEKSPRVCPNLLSTEPSSWLPHWLEMIWMRCEK